MKSVVICDVDGTLSDNSARRHYVEKVAGKKNWKAFFAAQHLDPLNVEVARIFEVLRNILGYGFIFSGRGEEHREVTETWLEEHEIEYDLLLMRPRGDHRQDSVVKLEMLTDVREQGYYPRIAIDDRNCVVAMWRSEGLTCLQVADGDF